MHNGAILYSPKTSGKTLEEMNAVFGDEIAHGPYPGHEKERSSAQEENSVGEKSA